MSNFKLKQKVTITGGNFYAPVNGYVIGVNREMSLGWFSSAITLSHWILSCTESVTYKVAYEQRGNMNRVVIHEYNADDLQSGWHGMTCNGDKEQFDKFNVKVPGVTS